MNPTLQARLERCATLPSLPGVAVQLVQLCQKEDLNLTELVSTLSSDPALTAKVLKLVNSSVYGRRSEVRTLSQAVMMMGTMSLQSLALSFSLVPAEKGRQQTLLQAFWRRAVTAAIAGRELAVAVRYPTPEEAFLCGLLQDLGVLALLQVAGPEMEALWARAEGHHDRLAALERATFGSDHAEVGQWLLKRWKLPEVLCAAIGQSHAPAPPKPLPLDGRARADEELGQITALSSLLTEVWRTDDVAAATDRARERLFSTFGLTKAEDEALLSRIATSMPEVARLFGVDLGSPDDITAVLEDAKEQLLLLSMQASQQVKQAHQTIKGLEDETGRLSEQASRDALTGLANRRRLDRALPASFAAAQSSQTPLTVVMCDIDHFKAINDTWGHPVGDDVIREVAHVVGGSLRGSDLAGRYGGEEFLLLLHDTPASGALHVAERIRERVQALKLAAADGKPVNVTISVGCATLVGGSYPSAADLVGAADKALYDAKRGGRNRVVAATQLELVPVEARAAAQPTLH